MPLGPETLSLALTTPHLVDRSQLLPLFSRKEKSRSLVVCEAVSVCDNPLSPVSLVMLRSPSVDQRVAGGAGVRVLSPSARGLLGRTRCPSFTQGPAGLGLRNPIPFNVQREETIRACVRLQQPITGFYVYRFRLKLDL